MGNELHQDSLLIQQFHTLRLAHSHASRAAARTQLMPEHSMGYICKKLCTKCRSKYGGLGACSPKKFLSFPVLF